MPSMNVSARPSRSSKRAASRGSSGSGSNTTSILNGVVALSIGMVGFFAGTLYTMHSGILLSKSCGGAAADAAASTATIVEEQVQRRVQEIQSTLRCPPAAEVESRHLRSPQHLEGEVAEVASSSGLLEFPTTMSKFMAGASRVSKTDFFDHLHLGVPMDPEHEGDSQVLVLHQRSQALPTRFQEYSEPIPTFETSQEALEHCEIVNIVYTDHSASKNQCLAIVPQYESFVMQRYLRLPVETPSTNNAKPNANLLAPEHPLRFVGRGMKNNGHNEFDPPSAHKMKQHMELLQSYLANLPASLADLKPLVEHVATPTTKTVIVMVSNFGQSELLVNFVCAAKSRGIDTSHILVFATDVETKDLAEHLGLTAFFDERNFGSMPQEAAGHYGDRKFTAMMMAKVYCVHMVSALDYNVLFQDVDIVWYQDPLPFLESSEHQAFDMLFQDDGGHTVRYAPYSANSGFYYVKANPRTKYFFQALLMSGDLILQTDSHQQALIALLVDHSSLYGLNTKVFSRDSWEFPGGYQYHQRSGQYMRDFFGGKIKPYLFHMSWTLNKDNKLLFLRQMGEWYVQDACVHQSVETVLGKPIGDGQTSDYEVFQSTCCAAEPLVSCHYRDKPSIIPCKDSPPIDQGRPSFWK